MKDVVFLGAKSIGYNCLKFLIDNKKALDINISAVLTNAAHKLSGQLTIPDLCSENNIRVLGSLKELLEHKDVDFLISVQYNNILKKEHIAKAKQLAINLHMAPLPEYRGCNQFSFAIIDEKKEFGTTLHVMDESVDGGDMLFERRFPIPENCFVEELYEKTVEESLTLFKEKIQSVFEGKYKRIKQSDLVAERGTSTHFRKEMEKLKVIDLSWEPKKIDRYVRATYFPPFDPPYAVVNGNKISLTGSKQSNTQPANH